MITGITGGIFPGHQLLSAAMKRRAGTRTALTKNVSTIEAVTRTTPNCEDNKVYRHTFGCLKHGEYMGTDKADKAGGAGVRFKSVYTRQPTLLSHNNTSTALALYTAPSRSLSAISLTHSHTSPIL